MNEVNNGRREPRLRYQWTVLFAADSKQTVSEGLMVDISSGGLAFRCDAGENCPRIGQNLVTHFSIPIRRTTPRQTVRKYQIRE